MLEWRKSVHYWWSILFAPECKELTCMLDPLLYRWGVPPVVIRCVHWTMQSGVLQTWITIQSPVVVMNPILRDPPIQQLHERSLGYSPLPTSAMLDGLTNALAHPVSPLCSWVIAPSQCPWIHCWAIIVKMRCSPCQQQLSTDFRNVFHPSISIFRLRCCPCPYQELKTLKLPVTK